MTTPAAPRCYRHPDRETYVRCTRCDRPICPECMHAASVGFQCPDDVADGRRTQRAPRNAVGALLRQDPPYVTAILFVVNVVVYAITALTSPAGLGQPGASRLVADWALQPSVVAADGSYYRLLTAAFLHENLLHIGVNMLSLIFVGPYLEREIGRWRFTALYLLSALGGNVAVYVFGAPDQPVIGASTALFGMLGGCLVLVRQLGLDVQWLVGVIVLNLVFTFSVANISRLGHIGGFVTGALAGMAIGGIPTLRQRVSTRNQVLGLSGLFALIVVLVVARAAVGVA